MRIISCICATYANHKLKHMLLLVSCASSKVHFILLFYFTPFLLWSIIVTANTILFTFDHNPQSHGVSPIWWLTKHLFPFACVTYNICIHMTFTPVCHWVQTHGTIFEILSVGLVRVVCFRYRLTNISFALSCWQNGDCVPTFAQSERGSEGERERRAFKSILHKYFKNLCKQLGENEVLIFMA